MLRLLPLFIVATTGIAILLSGCPSGGSGSGGTTSSQEQSSPETPITPSAPTAHQARGVDTTGGTVDLRFDSAVDPSSAMEVSNYSASGGQVLTSVEVLADSNTVRLHFETMLLPGSDTLSVSGVLNADGESFPAVSALSLSSDDNRAPRMTSVTLEAVPGVNNDLLVVVFDDDMVLADVLNMSNYTLQYPHGTTLTLQSENAIFDYPTRTLRVVLQADGDQDFDLLVGTNWSLSVSALRDLGGNTLVDGSNLSGSVSGDSQAPQVLAVTQNSLVDAGGSVIDIAVNEALDLSNSTVWSNFQSSNGGVVVQVDWLAAEETLRITLDRPVYPGVDTFSISGLTDPAGNVSTETSTFTIDTNDGIAPTLTSVLAATHAGYFNDEIIVVFDERIHPGDAVDSTKYTIESPVGTPLDLGNAEFVYDNTLWQTTIRFGGSYLWQNSTVAANRQLAVKGGVQEGDRYGASVAGIGDLDGDGFPDILIGAPRHDLPGNQSAGSVYILSGRTQELIRRLDGATQGAYFGQSVAALSDQNGDGIEDILVGAPRNDTDGGHKSGSLFVYSGANGSLLLQVDGQWNNQELGEYVASAGDVDHDGIADLLAGMPKGTFHNNHESGLVQVYSGVDGHLIHTWGGADNEDRAGAALAGNFDWNQDGYADILFGSERADLSAGNDAGAAYLYSGKTGALLRTFEGLARGDRFGHAVAVAGDWDGDSIPDIAIGAHYAKVGDRSKAGSVYIYAGVDGSLLFRIDGQAAGDELGWAIAGGHDLDGDGIADLLVGAPGVEAAQNHQNNRDDDDDGHENGQQNDGAVLVYSGANASLLRTFTNQGDGKNFGQVLAWAGDLDRDTFADLILAGEYADHNSLPATGRVRLEAGAASLPYTVAQSGTELTTGTNVQIHVDTMRDLAGNRMPAAFEQSVVLNGDLQAPLGIDVVRNLWCDATGATVDLRFSESVDLTASPDATFTTNTVANLLGVTLMDQGTMVRLWFDAPLTSGNATITASNIKDLAGNLMTTWSGTVVNEAGLAPIFHATSFTLLENSNSARIQVDFSQPILEFDGVSAGLWSLSTTGNTSVDLASATFTYDAMQQQLWITLPATPNMAVGAGYTLTVTSLRDGHGNFAPSLQSNGVVIAE